MQTSTLTQNRRAELFEAMAAFERDAQLTQETRDRLRALRASLARECNDDAADRPKQSLVPSKARTVAEHPSAEGIPANDTRRRILLRSMSLRAA